MTTKMSTLMLLGLSLVMTLASACTVVEGNGVPAEESRTAHAFSELEVRGDVLVTARIDPSFRGDNGYQIRVSGDENLLQHINTEVRGDRLIIDTSGVWLSPQLPLEVTLRADQLRILETSSDAKVRAIGMDQRSMRIFATDSSSVRLEGRVDLVRVETSGFAEVNALELLTWDSRVDASGASTAAICVEDRLEVQASQNAHVEFACNPYEVDEFLSDEARVTRF